MNPGKYYPAVFPALIIALALTPYGSALAWPAKVTEVVRGEEIVVLLSDGHREHLRLYGVDVPIEPQPFGEEARKYVAKRLLGKTVEVTPLIRDKIDRIVAYVYLDGESVGDDLLRKGLAWWDRNYFPWELGLARLQEEAKNAKVGLWVEAHPIPPWEYQELSSEQKTSPGSKKTKNRRGSIRERIVSEAGSSKPIIGDQGSVLNRLRKGREASTGDIPQMHDLEKESGVTIHERRMRYPDR
jgi:micrococcal nuclease